MALLKKVCHCGGALRFPMLKTLPRVSVNFPAACKRQDLQLPSVCTLPCSRHDDNGLNLWIHAFFIRVAIPCLRKPKNNNRLAMITVSLHSNKNPRMVCIFVCVHVCVSVCVYIHVCMWMNVGIGVWICTWVCMHMCKYGCVDYMCVWVWVCMHVYACVSTCVMCRYVWICVCQCVGVCTCVYECVCMYVSVCICACGCSCVYMHMCVYAVLGAEPWVVY